MAKTTGRRETKTTKRETRVPADETMRRKSVRQLEAELLERWGKCEFDSGRFMADVVKIKSKGRDRVLEVTGRVVGESDWFGMEEPIQGLDVLEAARSLARRFRAAHPRPQPKAVTMTGPGTAVAHEPVQAGELVSHHPPTPSMLVQTGHNAGVLCGYRQALDACAKNLRRQAQELRNPGVVMTLRGGVSGVSKLLHGDAQADLLDACAAAIEHEHAGRAAEEAQHTHAAQALLAAAGGGK